MHMLTAEQLAAYLEHDRVLRLLDELAQPVDEAFISQRWLRDTPGKRLMYDEIYGDLVFGSGPRRRILDVGGGFCSITRQLMAKHDYTLLEINAHDTADRLRGIEDETGRHFWIDGDWHAHALQGQWDTIIANDLFPNVDQRLSLFLERALRACAEARLSLTYHQAPRFYLTRRLEGDEILCMLAFDGERTRRALEPFAERIVSADLDLLERSRDSVFSNGRQVCIAKLRGSLPMDERG